MKLSNFRRILSTDYDEQYKPIIDRLGTSLNNAIDQINDALNNKKVTFEDNISSTVVSLNVTVDSAGVPLQSTSFKLDAAQSSVNGIIVVNAFGANNPNILPTSGVFVSFTKNQGYVTIDNVKGLLSNNPYTIKIICV